MYLGLAYLTKLTGLYIILFLITYIITEKKIKLKSKKKGGLSLSGRSEKKGELEEKEIALAGKGLAASSDVNSGKLSYDWVDKMEKIVIPEEEIQAFLDRSFAGGTVLSRGIVITPILLHFLRAVRVFVSHWRIQGVIGYSWSIRLK